MKLAWVVMAVVCPAPLMAQTAIETVLVGREVTVKMDMPATQQGIDLNFERTQPMDWNQYQQRLKAFGIAIHKGDVVRVTKVIEKKDRIEFQLAGGGFGTFGDDSNTNISPGYIAPSRYEKDLEKQVADEKDLKRKRDLQRDLDRERERRNRAQGQAANAAKIASQMKAEQVAGKRLQGGSRFNLRWKDIIPSDLRNPQAVEQSLAEYVDFSAQSPRNETASPPPPATGYGPPLQRGMKVTEVDALYGRGRLVSENVLQEGLKTQVIRYQTQDATVDVTFVEGVVVRYAIQSK